MVSPSAKVGFCRFPGKPRSPGPSLQVTQKGCSRHESRPLWRVDHRTPRPCRERQHGHAGARGHDAHDPAGGRHAERLEAAPDQASEVGRDRVRRGWQALPGAARGFDDLPGCRYLRPAGRGANQLSARPRSGSDGCPPAATLQVRPRRLRPRRAPPSSERPPRHQAETRPHSGAER